jgi:hypothetical protein
MENTARATATPAKRSLRPRRTRQASVKVMTSDTMNASAKPNAYVGRGRPSKRCPATMGSSPGAHGRRVQAVVLQ